jgi:DNA topoisomerase-1
LVGYNLTPLLWEKVRGRLSAGRVQSVALKLIVEREREIQAFIPQEFWTIEADFNQDGSDSLFRAKLVKINEKDPELISKEIVEGFIEELEKASYQVIKIKRGERKRKPYPPFITSTLQQQASNQLGFTAKRTMRIAQQLYEGIDIGEGSETGLITYMRTDSTQISPIAMNEVRQYILDVHGKEFLPEKENIHSTKVMKAQEAHEAIRPTSVLRTPEKIQNFLSAEQYKLYQLIWRRFVASQMNSAVFATLTVDISGTGTVNLFGFRASGSSLIFPGFLVLYDEAVDENKENGENGELTIPDTLLEGSLLKLIKLFPEQHFTQPQPRFTEASSPIAGRIWNWQTFHLCTYHLNYSNEGICGA